MKNPFQDRDLHTILLFPKLSWSSINCWEYDREEWYLRYVFGERSKSNPAMDAGRIIGERLATDPDYLPQVPRPEIYEQELRGRLGGIDLVGHLDGWSPSVPEIKEYKTTQNINRWTQEKVNEWGQITFYCLLVWLNFKIIPEKLKLSLTAIFLEEDGGFGLDPTGIIKVFPTTRSMKDLLVFGAYLQKTFIEMQAFIKSKSGDKLEGI